MVAGAVLVTLAIPVLHIHTADSGVDGLPRSLEIMQTYDRMQAAFPGETFSADIVVEGAALEPAEVRAAVEEMRQVARESDQFQEPVTVETSPRRPARGHRGAAGRHRHRRRARRTRSARCARTWCRDVFGGLSSGEVVGVAASPPGRSTSTT